MNKGQYAGMLREIGDARKQGGDVSACIAEYRKRYKYVYIYNDAVIKMLLGIPENESIAVDFFNAALHLYGSNCIEHLTFVNTELPGTFTKSTVSDIVAEDQRTDRIVLEVQHIEDESFNSRLVYYTSKHTVASLSRGRPYNLKNLNLISLQMFVGFPEWENYLHTIRLKNQDNEEFYKKQTITLVEVPKFLKGGFESDNSRFAQWLRVFDGLNNERPVPVPEGSQFALLQKKAELSKFTEEFLVSEAMKMSDREYELYVEKKHARAEGLEEGRVKGLEIGREEGRAEGRAEGADAKAREMALAMLMDNEPIEKIVKYSGLSEKEILELRRLQTVPSER